MAADKKSICFIIPKFVTFSTGGAELQVHKLSQQFLSMGWQVELICRGADYLETISQSPYYDQRIRYLYYRKSKLMSIEFLKVLFLLCHTRSRWFYNRTDDAATAAMVFYSRIGRKKSIYALACDHDAEREKYKNLFGQIEYRNRRQKWFRMKDVSLLDAMIEWAKRNSTLSFCQTQNQQRRFEANFGRRATIVPNSIQQADNALPPKENIVLWVGNLRPIKQPELYLEIAHRLKQHNHWQFVMIGEPDETTLPLLKQMENEPTFSFKGSLSYEQTQKWFSKSKVLINTSIAEGFPNTFLQAWQAKCLVLSLNANPDNLLSNDGFGKVFDNNSNQMIEYLDKYLHNPESVSHMLDKALHYVTQQFDMSRNIEKIMIQINNADRK